MSFFVQIIIRVPRYRVMNRIPGYPNTRSHHPITSEAVRTRD